MAGFCCMERILKLSLLSYRKKNSETYIYSGGK